MHVIHIIQFLNKMLFIHFTMTFISVPRHTDLMMRMLSLIIIPFIVIIEYPMQILREVQVGLQLPFIILFYNAIHCSVFLKV